MHSFSREECVKILGIQASASKEEIKSAFITRVKLCHPDLSKKDRAVAKVEFVKLLSSYRFLIENHDKIMKHVPPASNYNQSQGFKYEDNFNNEEENVHWQQWNSRRRSSVRRSNRDNLRNSLDAPFDHNALFGYVPSWLTQLQTELGDAIDFAFWGPFFPFDSALYFPYEFEVEERDPYDDIAHER